MSRQTTTHYPLPTIHYPLPQSDGAPELVVDKFLIACLRTRWDQAAWQQAHAMLEHSRVNWDAVIQAARSEGVAPLVYTIVRDKALVPPRVEQSLRTAYWATARRNAILFRQLAKVLRVLQARGIEVIVLKGAALAEGVYRNIAVRPMTDLDLLVRHQDASQALQVLAEQDYHPVDVEAHAGDAVAFEVEAMLHRPGPSEDMLEVHWGLLDSPYYQRQLPINWFWQTAQPVTLNDLPAKSLGCEAQVLYLCAHLMLHHRGQGLLWLHDIAEVVFFYQHEIDWRRVIQHAQACELVLPLQRLLPRIAGEWGAPVPEAVIADLLALVPSRAEERVFAWRTAQDQPLAQRFWADLSSMADWRTRVRYALGNLFPSPAYMQRRHRVPHPALLPLTYVLRWFIGLRSVLGHWSSGLARKP